MQLDKNNDHKDGDIIWRKFFADLRKSKKCSIKSPWISIKKFILITRKIKLEKHQTPFEHNKLDITAEIPYNSQQTCECLLTKVPKSMKS